MDSGFSGSCNRVSNIRLGIRPLLTSMLLKYHRSWVAWHATVWYIRDTFTLCAYHWPFLSSFPVFHGENVMFYSILSDNISQIQNTITEDCPWGEAICFKECTVLSKISIWHAKPRSKETIHVRWAFSNWIDNHRNGISIAVQKLLVSH